MEFVFNGELVKVVYTYRVDVVRKRDMEVVKEFAKSYGAGFGKGKAHGVPGEYRVSCYVEVVEPFFCVDLFADKLKRVLPDAKVCRGGMMKVETV